MDKSLYDIKSEFMDMVNQVDDLIESDDPEAAEKIEKLLAVILTEGHTDFKEKGTNIIKVIRHLEYQMKMLKEFKSDETKRIQKLSKFYENKVTKLKSGIVNALDLFGFGKYDFGTFKVHTRKNKGRVIVENIDAVSEDWKHRPKVLQIDHDVLMKAIQDGATVPGVQIVDAEQDEVFTESILDTVNEYIEEQQKAGVPLTTKQVNQWLAKEIPGVSYESKISLIIS